MDDDRFSTEDETDSMTKSLGSALDDITFKPLGRRIKVRAGRDIGRVRQREVVQASPTSKGTTST